MVTVIPAVRMAAQVDVQSHVPGAAVRALGGVPEAVGIAVPEAAAVALEAVEMVAQAAAIVHVQGIAAGVMGAGLVVLVNVKGVQAVVIMAVRGIAMATVLVAVIVNAVPVPADVRQAAEESVQAVPVVPAAAVDVRPAAAGVVLVIAGGVPEAAAAARDVQIVQGVMAVLAAAAAAAEIVILAARMHVLPSVRLRPAEAVAAHVLPDALGAVEIPVHRIVRRDARTVARPLVHRPAIPPAQTSASAVRNNYR